MVICRQSLTVWSLQAYSSLHVIFVQWGFPTWKNKYKQFQFWHFTPYHEFSHPQSSYFQKVVLSIFTTMSTAFIQAAFKEKNPFHFNTMKVVKIKTERVLLFVRSSGDRLCSHLHAAFLTVKAQILFSKTFSHDTPRLRDKLASISVVTCNSRDS